MQDRFPITVVGRSEVSKSGFVEDEQPCRPASFHPSSPTWILFRCDQDALLAVAVFPPRWALHVYWTPRIWRDETPSTTGRGTSLKQTTARSHPLSPSPARQANRPETLLLLSTGQTHEPMRVEQSNLCEAERNF